MSTKKKLIELVGKIAAIEKEERSAFSQINAYEIAQDKLKLLNELSKLYEELERKKKTPITKEMLEKNGYECHPSLYLDEYVLATRHVLFHDRNCDRWQIHNLQLITIADLEAAFDLCSIDKDIEL